MISTDVYFVLSPLVYRKTLTGDYLPTWYFRRALWADNVSSGMNTLALRTQFKAIRIGENLVMSYNARWLSRGQPESTIIA